MWERIYNSIRAIFTFGQDIVDLRKQNESLQQEVRRLTEVTQLMALKIQHNEEKEQHEREKLELRLKVEWLQNQLPPKNSER